MWTEHKPVYVVENSNVFFNNCYDCHKELNYYCEEDIINDNIDNNIYVEHNDNKLTLKSIIINAEKIIIIVQNY